MRFVHLPIRDTPQDVSNLCMARGLRCLLRLVTVFFNSEVGGSGFGRLYEHLGGCRTVDPRLGEGLRLVGTETGQGLGGRRRTEGFCEELTCSVSFSRRTGNF